MSIDVRQIKLDLRYPESRQEDITDAFTRGYMGAVKLGNRAIAKLEAENAKLRELVVYAYECAVHSDHATCSDCRRMNDKCLLADRMRELGIEVGE